jgi:gliding motility-associated-like protein
MRNRVLLLLICILQFNFLKAQMVGVNAYIKATSVEVGINGVGGFEGVDQFTSPPPAGMHARTTGLPFGFIANPQVNAWATYNGDFFTPGSPENGWGFEIGLAGVAGSNNYSGGSDIPGTITSYSHVGTCYNVDWEGDATSGTDLTFKVNYFLEETDIFYTTTVSITNNTAAAITDLYYYRNLDPDNNQELSGDFTTQNTIECQPGVGTSNVACVSATSLLPASQPQSYLGLAGIGANFRVIYGGFSNRDASDIWNGTGAGFVQTVGATNFADEAIAIAYRIPSLAPGATHTFKFVVILDAASATNIMTVSYPGSLPPSICDTAKVDTIQNCGTPVPLQITGSTVANYTWTWTPAAGLSTTAGPSTVASPTTTTTYVATGVPSSPCVPAVPVTVQFVMQVISGTAANPVIASVPPVCSGSSSIALSVDSCCGIWSGTGISTSGVFDPALAGAGTHVITYSIGATGPCQRVDTTHIVVVNSPSAIINQPAAVCEGAASFTITAASGGGTWSGTGVSPAGIFDPGTSGPGVHTITYSIPGTCVATDTVSVTVARVNAEPVITPVPMLCSGSSAVPLSVDSCCGTWSGPGISSSGNFDPSVAGAGTHNIIYTIGIAPCQSDDTLQVTVLSSSSATISSPPFVCDSSAVFNITAATGGGVWSGTGITNSSAGTFDPAVAGPGTHMITYTIPGTCPSADTAIVTVGAINIPVTGFSYPTSPICRVDTVTLPLTVAGFTSGGTYSASGFGLSLNTTTGAIDPAASTAGIYTVTYTVPATTCGPAGVSTVTVTIQAVLNPTTGFSYPGGLCDNDSAISPAGVSGFTLGGIYSAVPVTLAIDDSTGVVDIMASDPGTYTITYSVTGVDSLCTGSGTGTTSITINPLPEMSVTSDQVIWITNSTQLIVSGGTSYSWSPPTSLSCISCDTTVASPVNTTTYCATVTDSMGCVDSTCVKISVEIPCPTNRNLEVPNAFTPNGDGYNDELCLYGWNDCVGEFVIFIYDRWGEKVFESTDPDFCWDGVYKGKLLDPAVFVYFIKATYITSGESPISATDKVIVSKNGNISIVH